MDRHMDPISALSSMAANAGSDEKVSQRVDTIVVLLNSNDMNEDYMQEMGIRCHDNVLKCVHLCPIEFTFVNIKQLSEALLDVHNWSALCVTSKRCVDAIELAISYDHNIIDLWIKNNKKVFVVGIKSYEYLKERLEWEAIGSDGGNGDNLAQLMVNEYRDELMAKEVLFPCSESRSDSLPQSLAKADICVNEIIVYKTTPNRHLESKVTELRDYLMAFTDQRVSKKLKLIFIFFSPSGLKSVYPFLTDQFIRNEKIRDNYDVKYVAIGGTTGAALQQLALDVWFCSPKPNPKSLAQTLSQYLAIETLEDTGSEVTAKTETRELAQQKHEDPDERRQDFSGNIPLHR